MCYFSNVEKCSALYIFPAHSPDLKSLEWVGTLSVKNRRACILGFVGHSSVAMIHLCYCHLKAATDNI